MDAQRVMIGRVLVAVERGPTYELVLAPPGGLSCTSRLILPLAPFKSGRLGYYQKRSRQCGRRRCRLRQVGSGPQLCSISERVLLLGRCSQQQWI